MTELLAATRACRVYGTGTTGSPPSTPPATCRCPPPVVKARPGDVPGGPPPGGPRPAAVGVGAPRAPEDRADTRPGPEWTVGRGPGRRAWWSGGWPRERIFTARTGWLAATGGPRRFVWATRTPTRPGRRPTGSAPGTRPGTSSATPGTRSCSRRRGDAVIGDNGLVVPIVLPGAARRRPRRRESWPLAPTWGSTSVPGRLDPGAGRRSRIPLETVVAPNKGASLSSRRARPIRRRPCPARPGRWAATPGRSGQARAGEGVDPAGVPGAGAVAAGGVDVSTVDRCWTTGWPGGSGRRPQTQVCHDCAVDRIGGSTPQDTYRTRMLAGTWSEWVGPRCSWARRLRPPALRT